MNSNWTTQDATSAAAGYAESETGLKSSEECFSARVARPALPDLAGADFPTNVVVLPPASKILVAPLPSIKLLLHTGAESVREVAGSVTGELLKIAQCASTVWWRRRSEG